VDPDLQAGATYQYSVAALDSGGNLAQPSVPISARSRTAPRINDHGATWQDGRFVIEIRGTDADDDVPAVAAVVGNATYSLEVFSAPGGWLARAELKVAPGHLGAQLRYHVEADDGVFSARWPPANEAVAPPSPPHLVEEPRGLFGAQRVPAPAFIMILAALVIVAITRRSRS
ncbi:MAG: hypothetical protein WDA16_12415, partial [Candidatus Thermoplasmatota archaeon]